MEGNNDGPSFLTMFVECCTGLNYLPYGKPENEITVEFNYALAERGGFPKFWTCNREIVLPGFVYADYDEFSEKLEKAVELSFGQFDMN